MSRTSAFPFVFADGIQYRCCGSEKIDTWAENNHHIAENLLDNLRRIGIIGVTFEIVLQKDSSSFRREMSFFFRNNFLEETDRIEVKLQVSRAMIKERYFFLASLLSRSGTPCVNFLLAG